jgi:hypothetical protein
MKKIITYIILFVFFFCLNGYSQRPGDTKILADNHSRKGKRELRKESKSWRHEQRTFKRQERKADRLADRDFHKKTLGNRSKKRKANKAMPVRNG